MLAIEVGWYYSSGTSCSSGNQTVKSVTYNSLAATAVPSSIACATKGSGVYQTELFYLPEPLPSAGSYTVAVTFSAAVTDAMAGAISMSNVAQGAPEAVATNAVNSNASSISTSIITKTNGSMVVDIFGFGASQSSVTAGSGQTKEWSQETKGGTSNSSGGGSVKSVATAGATTMSWTTTASKPLAQSVASFAP